MSIATTTTNAVALYDSVTGRAFGPVFECQEHADDFMAWAASEGVGPLERLPLSALSALYTRWFELRLDADGNIALPDPDERTP